jgi:hypothetical protein
MWRLGKLNFFDIFSQSIDQYHLIKYVTSISTPCMAPNLILQGLSAKKNPINLTLFFLHTYTTKDGGHEGCSAAPRWGGGCLGAGAWGAYAGVGRIGQCCNDQGEELAAAYCSDGLPAERRARSRM